jgi:hypothetical protein
MRGNKKIERNGRIIRRFRVRENQIILVLKKKYTAP